ncbi:MAG: anti-sigma factor, partial [Chryseobacterium sp.]
ERWYNVKFIYPSGFKNNEKAFFSVNRTVKLSSVLKALERTYGLHFQIYGKEVLIK